LTDIIQSPAPFQLVGSDGLATVEFLTWLDQVTIAVSNIPPLVGSGSPEGVVVASVGRWYVDTDSLGTGVYLKESGDGDTGWQARS
jgi:hypothetical protein